MTKSTITREQLLEIIETDHVQCGEASQLARMALAAMDSEPVAWTWHYREQWHVTNDEERARDLAWDGVKVEQLYRHAQPAPELKPVGYLFISDQGAIVYSPTDWGMPGFRLVGKIYGDIDVESQPAPTCESITVTDDMAYAFHHALTDSMIGADDVEEIKTGLRAVFANLTAPVVSAEYPDRLPCSVLLEPGMRFGKGIKTSTMLAALARRAVHESDMAALSPEERVEFQARIEDFKALIAQPGTVVPDEKDKTVDADDHPLLWSFNEGWNACRAAMLAAAPQPQNAPQNIPEIIPDCWCRTCRPVVLNDMRFVVCPDCGNKRCPRANDHRNACTGSNEPGQEGSAYPDTPQEVKGE